MYHRYPIKSLLLCGICTLLFFVSCKKEYLSTPYNDIESFIIKDALGNNISASFVGDSILVYYPPFQDILKTVKPEIAVSAGASINPASGQEINLKTGEKYQVTAQDGSIRNYVLKLAVNQPVPLIDRVSIGRLGTDLAISGNYFIPDSNQTQLFLIDENKKDHRINLVTASRLWSNSIRVLLPLEGMIDTGTYDVKLVSGFNTVIKGPYYVGKPAPANAKGIYQFDQVGQQIKVGAQISFTYSLQAPFSKYYYGNYSRLVITMVNDGNNVYYAPITEQTNTSLKFTLPANIKTGSIGSISIQSKGDKINVAGIPMYTWSRTSATTTTIIP
ncbi:hypothetical protein [Pedobacter sp. N23S346]|uniref:hypothetical protein n=1 Tax=Pedobacter sp. N23S346 TaxID=3402750 RepID=UPI003AD013E2